MAIDPVCGMKVDESSGLKLEKDGDRFFFCSSHCRDKFVAREGLRRESVPCLGCGSGGKGLWRNKLFLTCLAAAALIAASFFLPFLLPLRRAFMEYLVTIWWAVLLGLLAGGIIDYYVPPEYISRILARKRPVTIFNAVLLGFLMSACSHGILALTIQLHKKGASNPAVVSFLLASPWANLTITIMLFGFFGARAVFIILSAVLIACTTGFIYMFLERKGLIEHNKNTAEIPEGFSVLADLRKRAANYNFTVPSIKRDAKGVFAGTLALANMVLWWIILGMMIASAAAAFIPVHVFHKFMGPSLLGLAVTLALATVIEVCSEGSSPLAFEIYRQTHALGNSFAFLMGGVVTDYTEIGLLWTNVGRRVALFLPLVTIPQVILLSWIANVAFQ